MKPWMIKYTNTSVPNVSLKKPENKQKNLEKSSSLKKRERFGR